MEHSVSIKRGGNIIGKRSRAAPGEIVDSPLGSIVAGNGWDSHHTIH